MDQNRWREIELIFQQVVDLPAAGREAALAPLDPALRAEILSLLACDAPGAETLHGLVSDQARAVVRAEDEAWIGRRLGPWRVTRILGHGGMGTVLEAVRDDAQYDKRVAIKLVKRDLDSEIGRRRFLRERQILAALDHPAIARLLDGGATGDGMPYLVMEFIEGEDILSFAATQKLSVEARLRLFLDVLDAVANAHQKLIVHRDLKPANILVTPEGRVKLLDFGIARLLDESADGATSAALMTPEYASPEQVRGEPASTAGDVYSLGAILYELLTGARAHQFTTHSPAEIVQVVCKTIARRPSEVAGEFSLRKRLSGDLDVIAMTALHKDAGRRYASAEAMAEDVRRYLEGQPIRARKDTLLYRYSKFLRRNRAVVAAAAAAALALIAGTLIAVAQARRADHRFQQVRRLSHTLLFDISRKIQDGPGATALREMLVNTSLQYLDSLAPDAPDDPGLELELAEAYLQVGNLQDSMTFGNLAHARDAAISWARAVSLAEDVARRKRDPQAFLLMSQGRFEIGQARLNLLEIDESERQVRLGLEAAAELQRIQPANAQICHSLSSGYNRLGDALMVRGAVVGALTQFELAEQTQVSCAKDPQSTRPSGATPTTLLRKADAVLMLGRAAEAQSIYQRALEASVRSPYLKAVVETQLGFALGGFRAVNLGRPQEAATRLRSALHFYDLAMEKDPRNLQSVQDYGRVAPMLSEVLLDSNPREAAAVAARSLELIAQHVAENHGDTQWDELLPMNQCALGRARAKLGHPDGRELLDSGKKAWETLTARNRRNLLWQTWLALSRLDWAEFLSVQKQHIEAGRVLAEARKELEEALRIEPAHAALRNVLAMVESRQRASF